MQRLSIMNMLQRTELEILKECLIIIEKYELKYYLVCGSALGAVKYNGFIPWDDDIDIALPRKDYLSFLNYAASELPKWAFVQNYRTDPNFPLIGTKIRDSRTTYIEKPYSGIFMNHGVFIDVFPLDGIPTNEKEIAVFEKRKKKYHRYTVVNVKYPHFRKGNWKGIRTNIIWIMNRIFGMYARTDKALQKLTSLFEQYPCEESSIWINYGNSQSKIEEAPYAQYGKGTWVTFEGLKVRIPEKYDEYLTQKYGDWRAELPKEQQVGHHYYEIMDLNRPYTDYIESVSKDGTKIKLKTISKD